MSDMLSSTMKYAQYENNLNFVPGITLDNDMHYERYVAWYA